MSKPLACCVTPEGVFYVVCDDGTVFRFWSGVWEELPSLPEDEPVEEEPINA